MDGLELLCFEIITAVGSARSSYIEAMQVAKSGDFAKAEEMIEEGKKQFREGHAKHALLIQNEAAGEATPINLLLVHAEDQMMSAEVIEIMTKEIIALYKRSIEN